MSLWSQGHANAKVRKQIGDGRLGAVVDGKLVTVWRSSVGDWCDDYFFSCLDLWWRWKTFGSLPFSGGWAEQPSHLTEIIETAEAAHKAEGARKK